MKLPSGLSGQQMRKALEQVGFTLRRQKGSHMILRRDEPYAMVVVPAHVELRVGTLRQILRDADLSVEELLRLLDGASI